VNVAALHGQVLSKRSGDGVVVIDQQDSEASLSYSSHF
jgi:hypothetical protein